MSQSSEPPSPALPLPELSDRRTGRAWPLRVVNSIGRDPGNDVRVDDGSVSSQHAVLRWDGERWTVRDLASTNGTFVDDARIEPGIEVGLELMASLAFGDPDRRWWLAADGPPRAFAESLTRPGQRVESASTTLGLPSNDDPRVMIFRGFPHWNIEDDAGTRPVADREVVAVGGHLWRLALPTPSDATQGLAVTTGKRIRIGGTLHGPIVEVLAGDEVERVKGRQPLRLLWMLAQEFFADVERTGEDRGLTHVDVIANQLRISPSAVDVYVHRLRDRFADMGIYALIERRKGVGQLRLGFDRIDFKGRL